MSQPVQRNLKVNAKSPVLLNKGSGDRNTGKSRNHSEECRNSLPKNLRYDLETALVGLCDVWFKEIKPYLVHNNIKVHVNRDVCGDQKEPPPQPSECSHLDPGISHVRCLYFNAFIVMIISEFSSTSLHRRRHTVDCVSCCSTQPTASKAPSAKRVTTSSKPTSKHSPKAQSCDFGNGLNPRRPQTKKPGPKPIHQMRRILYPCNINNIPRIVPETDQKANYEPKNRKNAQSCDFGNDLKPRRSRTKKPAPKAIHQMRRIPRLCNTHNTIPAIIVPKTDQKVSNYETKNRKNMPKTNKTCNKNSHRESIKNRNKKLYYESNQKENSENPLSNTTCIQECKNETSASFKEDLSKISYGNDRRLRLIYKSPDRSSASFRNQAKILACSSSNSLAERVD